MKGMITLPDFLDTDLILLSIGLNPSPASVRAGYYFAGRNNRFWLALNASDLIAVATLVQKLTPGASACRQLRQQARIGFTDVVKRPSRGAADLRAADFRAADFREWVPHLAARIECYRPLVLWFHGKVAYRQYLHCRDQPSTDMDWGLQPRRQQGCRVYLSPNPSAANAVFRLQDLVADYNKLAALYRRLRR